MTKQMLTQGTSIGDIREKLGALPQATQRMQEVGEDISSLQDILSSPKLRGQVGEFLLSNLLSQVLPPNHYTLQHSFKSGARVDALIDLGTGKVPVDSKFPLENFEHMAETKAERERKSYRRAFVRDVKGHINAIADKYILPDEGTFDFALMYILAENVYYEIVIREEKELLDYALTRRVIPVLPSSFYAYLQVILLGLRGFRIEAKAKEIIGYLDRLAGDFQRFQENYETLGTHLRHARNKYEAADRTLASFGDKLLGAVELPGGIDEEKAHRGNSTDR